METERVVLVTGAAGGVGALFAQRFLAHGDTVIATDTSDEGLAKAGRVEVLINCAASFPTRRSRRCRWPTGTRSSASI